MTPANPRSRATSGGRSCLTVVLVFVVYVVGSVILLMLPTGFIGLAFVTGGFVLVFVIGLHYVIWGRWLTQILADEAERNRETDAQR